MDIREFVPKNIEIIDKPKFKHIALDLELERPNTEKDALDSKLSEEKIIQLGYVVFEVDPFVIIKKESIFINIGVPLSGFIKKLTGITDENISSGTTIEEAYNTLVKDCEDYQTIRVVKCWGGGDMVCLQKEVPNLDWSFGRSGCNVKHLYQVYAEAKGLNRSGGLKKCLRKCGLEFEGSAHDATNDALNTAKMYSYLLEKLKS